MEAKLRPVEEVANAAISAVGWTDTETATKHAVSILTTDRDTAYTLFREETLKYRNIVSPLSEEEFDRGYVIALDDILTLLDHIYGKTDALTK